MENLINCPSCNSQNTKEVGQVPATDIFGGRVLPSLIQGGALFHCANCDLRFKYPRTHEDELNLLYAQTSLDNWQYTIGTRKDWEFASMWIQTEFPLANILDVGCFNGIFFTLLPSSCKFYGIEINSQAAEKARQNRAQIIGSNFSALAKCNADQFDVLTAFDVIEHVIDPVDFLKQAIRVVRPGGIIIIATGNALSRAWSLMGSRYYYVVLAEHLSFISSQWCRLHSRDLGVNVEEEQEFSHVNTSAIYIKIKQIVLNMTYRFFFSFFAWLRKHGLSDKNVGLHPELINHPPQWGTAKDHFIIKLRKM